jgi:cobalt/nickel transport system permease protein
MKHHFLDQYSDGNSFLHRLDPRAKFLAALAFVFAVVLTPVASWFSFGLFLVQISIVGLLSRVSPMFLFKRSLTVLPFVLVVAVFMPFLQGGETALSFNIGSWHINMTRSGLEMVGTVMAKAWLSILALSLLAATTRMSDLLKGMEKLKAPSIMVMLMSFMYRYLFVLTDESQRLLMARNSRHINGGLKLHVRTVGHMAGSLFVRSFERGERIYGAMLARGYDGHSRTLNPLHFKYSDIVFMTCALILILVVGLSPLFKGAFFWLKYWQ